MRGRNAHCEAHCASHCEAHCASHCEAHCEAHCGAHCGAHCASHCGAHCVAHCASHCVAHCVAQVRPKKRIAPQKARVLSVPRAHSSHPAALDGPLRCSALYASKDPAVAAG